MSSFSALMGALQQESSDACRSDSEFVQCASRRYGSSSSGRPCDMHGGIQKMCFNRDLVTQAWGLVQTTARLVELLQVVAAGHRHVAVKVLAEQTTEA